MVAARLLVIKGLFVQSRTLVRTVAEMTDLAAAILLDEKVLLGFIDPSEDFDAIYEIWRKVLAPRHLRLVIEKFWKDLGLPEELQQELVSYAKYDQRWLSLSAHSYRVALLIGGVAHDATRIVRDDHDLELAASVQGGSATLRTMVNLSAHFLQIFLRVRVDRFSWRGNRNDSEQKWTYVRGMLVRDIWITYLTEGADDGEIPDNE